MLFKNLEENAPMLDSQALTDEVDENLKRKRSFNPLARYVAFQILLLFLYTMFAFLIIRHQKISLLSTSFTRKKVNKQSASDN